jgi:predicted RND superfamily exporter protein
VITRQHTFALTAALVVVNVFALWWLPALKTGDDYRLLLQTNTSAFQQYLTYQKTFDAHESDVLLFVQGDVLSASSLQQLQSLTAKLEALESVTAVNSLLGIPWVQRNIEGLLAGEASLQQELKSRLADRSYFPVQMVSADRRTTVISATLNDTTVNSSSAVSRAVDDVRNTVVDALPETLTVTLAGFPVLRTELRQQAGRDAIVFGGLSVLFAMAVAWVFQRSLLIVAVSVLAPLSAVVCSLALMAYFDVPVNILNQMMIALVLVITYSDVLHIIRQINHCRAQGLALNNAVNSTYATVMKACFVTSVTTAAGFASLLLAGPAMIKQCRRR